MMIFLPSYSVCSASNLGWMPGRSLNERVSHVHVCELENNGEKDTYTSLATLCASIPTGQCATAATCPSTSIPRDVPSYPHTRIHVDVKCLEYEYVYEHAAYKHLKREYQEGRTHLETNQIRTQHPIQDLFPPWQTPKHLRAREWRVQEQSHRCLR